MKPLTITLLLIAPALLCSAQADDLTTLNGEKFTNATITRTEPDGIVLMTSTGIIKVPFAELSPELQAKYHYEPAKAAAFTNRISAQQAAIVRRTAEATAEVQQRRETEAARDAVALKRKKDSAWLAARIARHEAWIGMTLEQAGQALSAQPDVVRRTVTDHGVDLDWSFASGKTFHFENGVLVSFRD